MDVFLVSRASMTCLLEWSWVLFFFGVKGVDDVLAGRGAGFGRFVGVKGIDDVLAGVEPYGGVYGDSAVDGFFADFPRFSRSSGLSRS